MARIVLLFTRGPDAGGAARDGLDAGLAALAFDHDLQVLFDGAGVSLLRPLHAPGDGLPDWRRGLRALPLHGAAVGADRIALAMHGLDAAPLLLDAEALDLVARRRWLSEADVVLAF